jgi:release factor glutamine methyltransferase
VYLAFQAARDSSRRAERLLHLCECLSEASWQRIEQIAAAAGVRSALKWAVGEVRRSSEQGAGTQRPGSPPVDHLVLRGAWNAAAFLGAGVRPRWWGQRISGTVGFGTSSVLCRFGGTEIVAGPGAFVPEVTSERLVELALEVLEPFTDPVVVEPGTGSGAIALAIAERHPGASVYAIEKYRPAFRWARRNARSLGCKRVHLHRGSLLDPLPQSLRGRVALVVANLPYVPSAVWAAKGRFVRQAIRGQGIDGLDLYRRLVRQSASFLQPNGHLVLEMGPYQVDTFRSEASSLGYSIERVEPEVLGAVVVIARLGGSGGSSDGGLRP